MANYINQNNKKAYNFLVNAGYTLVPAYKHYTIACESFISPTRFTGDYAIPYNDSSLIIAISPIYIVQGWKSSSRAFHKFLKSNNLLLS
jgi:hypothetical protein